MHTSSVFDFVQQVLKSVETGIDNQLLGSSAQFYGSALFLVQSNFGDVFPLKRSRAPETLLRDASLICRYGTAREPETEHYECHRDADQYPLGPVQIVP